MKCLIQIDNFTCVSFFVSEVMHPGHVKNPREMHVSQHVIDAAFRVALFTRPQTSTPTHPLKAQKNFLSVHGYPNSRLDFHSR